MKEPRVSDLEIDPKGTERIRKRVAHNKSVKITINVDAESLAVLRKRSAKTGIPYQRLLNRVLKKALQDDKEMESRLDHLERELNRLKQRLSA